jgi:hypothetical protein
MNNTLSIGALRSLMHRMVQLSVLLTDIISQVTIDLEAERLVSKVAVVPKRHFGNHKVSQVVDAIRIQKLKGIQHIANRL